MSSGVVNSSPMKYSDRERPAASLRHSSTEGARNTYCLWIVSRSMVSDPRSVLSSRASICCCCTSSGLVLTTVVDFTSGEESNAASVLEASCLGNGLGARLVSSSPVMLLSGTNCVSWSRCHFHSPPLHRDLQVDDLEESQTRWQVASCANVLDSRYVYCSSKRTTSMR